MSQCDVILNQGLRDKRYFTSIEDIKSFVKEAFSWTYETFVSNRSKSSGGGKFSVFSYFELSGSGESDQQKFESLKASYNASSEKFFEHHAFQSYYEEITNPSVVNAWLKCITNQTEVLGYITGEPTEKFTFILNYKPDQTTDGPSKITGISSPYSTPTGDKSIYVGAVLKPFSSLAQAFTRIDPNKPAAITVTFDNRPEVVVNLPTGPTIKDVIAMINEQKEKVSNIASQLSLLQTQVKIDFKQYDVKPNSGAQEKFSFSFPVKHAWIEVIDCMDFVKNMEVLKIVDKTVEFSWSTTKGSGRTTTHVNFRLWVVGF